MSALNTVRLILVTVIGIGVLVVSAIALVDAITRPERAFASEGKRTKKFWLLVLGAGALVALLGALSMVSIMLNLIALVPAAVYWYDVRPEVKPYGTTRGVAKSQRSDGATNSLNHSVNKVRARKLSKSAKVPDYFDPDDWK